MKKTVFEVSGFKALTDDAGADTGDFEAIVSVFGNVDLVGDRVVKGAFEKSLAAWQAKGDPIPVIWSHQWEDPNAHIGFVDPGNATETDGGLLVKGRLDIDTNDFAAQVYRLLKARRVKEFSFAYDVVSDEKAADGATNLTELNLIEVGPTLRGANPDTQLLGVKDAMTALGIAAGEKAGRVLSKANETKLREARDAIDTVLASLPDEAAVEAAGAKADEVKTEEPEAATPEVKVDEPGTDPRHVLTRIAIEEASL